MAKNINLCGMSAGRRGSRRRWRRAAWRWQRVWRVRGARYNNIIIYKTGISSRRHQWWRLFHGDDGGVVRRYHRQQQLARIWQHNNM